MLIAFAILLILVVLVCFELDSGKHDGRIYLGDLWNELWIKWHQYRSRSSRKVLDRGKHSLKFILRLSRRRWPMQVFLNDIRGESHGA